MKNHTEMLKELIDAAQAVIDYWETGSLADAVNILEGTIIEARELIDYPNEESE